VGELVYQLAAGGTTANTQMPSTTFYGDFGIDLAKAIIASPVLSADLETHTPENLGRATVYGLALNSTEISGGSIYLPNPDLLPLLDIPILAKLPFDAPKEDWQQALTLASLRSNGACLQITQTNNNLQQIRAFAQMLSKEILASHLKKPLVLLIEGNLGKTLGNYITNWGKLSIQLVVIDELATRDAHFVNLGKLQQGVVPVSFYGMY
jgi:ethanolamine utilization protein EutA